MFIIERLISLSCFVGCLFFTLFLLSNVSKRSCIIVLTGYLLTLTLFAYFFKPNVLDLSRLQDMCLRGWCYYSWDTLYHFLETSPVPMWHLFSWTIFNFTHDLNYIQAITCFWCFGNVFYVINDLIMRYNLKGLQRALLLFSIMAIGTFYMQTISDIRNMLSFSICFFCIYREMIQGKSIVMHIPLYICAASFHQAGSVLVGGRMMALVPSQKTFIRKILFGVTVLCITVYLALKQNVFLDFAQNKFYAYTSDPSAFRSWKGMFVGLVELFQIFYVLLRYRIYTNLKQRDLWLFTMFLSLSCLVFVFFSYVTFRRYTMMGSLLILPLVAPLLSSHNIKKQKTFALIFFVLSLILFVSSYTIDEMRFYQFLM